MGLRGPAPKSTQFKIMAGRPGVAKAAAREPHFRPVAPDCPAWLNDLAKAEWARLAPELERLRLLTSADMAAFACYCLAYSDLQSAEAVLQEKGRTYSTEKGFLQARLEVRFCNRAMKQIKDFAVQFGFTPSARGRIDLPPDGRKGKEDLD